MTIAEMLQDRRSELQAQLAALQKDLEDLEIALAAISSGGGSRSQTKRAQAPSDAPEAGGDKPTTIDQAIIVAVSNRARTPAQILAYLREDLGVSTTINSVRTRVSKLKKEKKLVSTAFGWMVPALPVG